MSKLTGKVAVVTGASKGIGAGIATELARLGAAVVVNYLTGESDAARVVAAIAAEGGRAVAVPADVSNAAEVRRMFDQASRTFGGLDILVNNAGLYRLAGISEVTEADFHRHFDTNVLGILLVTQEALKHFSPDGGSIINIGSIGSRLTVPGTVVYTASKSAVDAITGVLARELGPKKIRVNSINPGLIETEGQRAHGLRGEDVERLVVSQTPLGRIGRPGDVAPVAAFLASPESAWLTGETLIVSGGMR